MADNRDFNAEIAQKIRAGDYFKEAWDWYALQYIYPVTQRTFLIFISALSLLITLWALLVLYNFYPLKVRVPIAVAIKDMGMEYSNLQKLVVPEKTDPNLPIMEYLVKLYITNMETYNYNRIEPQRALLASFSKPDLFAEIDKRYDIRNLNSIVLKFRQHTTRNIRLTPGSYKLEGAQDFGVEKPDQNDILRVDVPYRATMQFESDEENSLGTTTKKWMAEVNFTMSPVYYDKTKKAFRPLDFKVNSYRVTPL